MRRIRDMAVGIWEFVAGDDWVSAAGVAVALGVTALIGDSDESWFIMPLAVALLLALSIRRRARPSERRNGHRA
jgi:hypothetical protein